ncbi:dynein regulatory complex subunit 2-like isoform X2 [Physella acuta]|uniref:dynein regulatory complex subunit 2-like isoform X2 n=1 Tax=Physella acuta TaxID=109671 RepID=UPI0027DB1EDA|nr:dynein regulatory complex subunit 2-like isoform X2 [Physella acuta]XP_059149145.1 dynein regulatory complex subunit 2-like isoform X2 [Physella acuta]XP_059149146.1 dynein regulatory complex subunit 2-like isoform X2 [Physella acuta]
MGKKKARKDSTEGMTEEEKLAYEEMKRYAEEEMKRKKEHLLKIFMKDKLAKEEKATRYNLNKLNHQWRNIMREAKSKELKKDIEILSQTFERVIDRKDAVIKSLCGDIAEAEEQYAMALRSHIQNTDFLLDLQKSRLDTLTREYCYELEIICEEFDLERAMLLEQHNMEMNDIADILFAMDQTFQDRENESMAEFHSLRDEIKNKNLEDKHVLRVHLETKVEDLWQQFRQALQNYNETNEERKSSFEQLKIKDEKSSREIDQQMRKLQRISDQISQLRAKLSSNAKESEEKNKLLKEIEDDEENFNKEERERMQQLFHDLKSQMNQVRDNEREKLTKLTLESNAAIKEIKRQKEKGELILKLAEMCRKLETEEEKVLPFYASSLTQEEQDDVAVAMVEFPSTPMAQVMHEYSSMENFWKRYNKVLLDKLAMDKEKQTLMHENQQLRMLLKQYLDGISVNDEILSQVNPLFVVNNKTNVKLNVPVMDSRVRRPVPQTVIEAAHAVKHILM